jgi:outer membrane protein assembly factor BamB
MRNLLVLPVTLLLLAGCSWFGDEDEEDTKPAALVSIQSEVKLSSVWSRSIGGSAKDRASRLVAAVSGGRIFAASADGNIMALESGSGRPIWEVDIKDFYSADERKVGFAAKSDAITGGVGVGGDLVLAGTFAGEVIALNQSDGSLAWRTRTTSEVLAPPQADRDLVVAQSIDGKVAGFDALDGSRRWLYSALIPSLTLRGTTTPIIRDDYVITGFANGRMVVLERERGLAGLDRRIAVAQGKSDLERLVDIDGRIIVEGSQLFVASYQGTITAFELTTGRPRWSHEASTAAGLGIGFGNVYIAEANGRVVAYDMDNGKVVWENDALKNRQLSTPVAISSYIAVGDLDGYIHLIAQADGRFVGRKKVYSGPLKAPVTVDGARMYVMTENGRLQAFEIR